MPSGQPEPGRRRALLAAQRPLCVLGLVLSRLPCPQPVEVQGCGRRPCQAQTGWAGPCCQGSGAQGAVRGAGAAVGPCPAVPSRHSTTAHSPGGRRAGLRDPWAPCECCQLSTNRSPSVLTPQPRQEERDMAWGPAGEPRSWRTQRFLPQAAPTRARRRRSSVPWRRGRRDRKAGSSPSLREVAWSTPVPQGWSDGQPLVTHLRRSLAFSEAREALQELSSGLLSAVGRVWSSTVRSLPCFHSS